MNKSIQPVLIDTVSNVSDSVNTIKHFLDRFTPICNGNNITLKKPILFNGSVGKNGKDIIFHQVEIHNKKQYSRFCLKYLYKYVEADYVFIIQNDSYIYDVNYWDNRYLDYDYIGAPTWYEPLTAISSLQAEWYVGNGGFSIRSYRLLEEMSKDKYMFINPEDMAVAKIYGYELKDNGFTFAPMDLAMQFCYEPFEGRNIFYHNTFGIHGIRSVNLR